MQIAAQLLATTLIGWAMYLARIKGSAWAFPVTGVAIAIFWSTA